MTSINNNPFIDVYNTIEYVLRTYVTDINAVRSALPTAIEKQWIFPYTPESLTLYYPRIAIILNSVSYSEFSAGQFYGYDTELDGSITESKANYVIMNLTIGVFTKKKDKHLVTLPGGSSAKSIAGSLLNFYMLGEVQKALLNNRSYFLQNGVEDIEITGITPTYNDNEILFASNINLTVVMPNIWGTVYTTDDLIKVINIYYWIGYTGITGPTGIIGPTGSTGLTGPTGP